MDRGTDGGVEEMVVSCSQNNLKLRVEEVRVDFTWSPPLCRPSMFLVIYYYTVFISEFSNKACIVIYIKYMVMIHMISTTLLQSPMAFLIDYQPSINMFAGLSEALRHLWFELNDNISSYHPHCISINMLTFTRSIDCHVLHFVMTFAYLHLSFNTKYYTQHKIQPVPSFTSSWPQIQILK